MEYPEYVARIITKLERRGYEAYIVGGSVRDMLLGKAPHDYDVTTSAKPEEILDVFSDMRTIPTGIKHGTVTVLSDGEPIEVTTFRIDGEYLDSRRPERVFFTDDVTADLSRRDFTVNAMAYSEKRGLIDVFGGKDDLRDGIIRAVGVPEERFREDALRIMRAFRFSSQLGFRIEKNTLDAAKKMRDGLSKIAAERIAGEFIRTVCNNTVSTTLDVMAKEGILEYVLGKYTPSKRVLSALDVAKPLPQIRLGILLSEADTDEAVRILRSIKLSNKLVSDSKRIADELRTGLGKTEADARRLMGRVGELALDVLAAAEALGALDSEFCLCVKASIEKEECVTIGSLAVHGDAVIKLGAKGREVGKILEYLLSRVLEDPTLNEKEKLLALAKTELERLNGEKNG